MSDLFVSSTILIGASKLVRAHGQDPDALARRVGLPSAALENPAVAVPAEAMFEFFEQAALSCHNRNWGLELSLNLQLPAVVGPLWMLLRTARTVRQMCLEMVENFDLYSNAAAVDFETQPDEDGLLSWNPRLGASSSAVQATEFSLAMLAKELHSHSAPDAVPKSVFFRHAPPDDLRLHRRLFGTNLYFDCDRNALLIDCAVLDQRLLPRTPAARGTIRRVLRRMDRLVGGDIPAQVESIVRATLPLGPCNLPDVSRAMGVAPRTLQAQLKRHGSTFCDIRDRVRADLALKYVRDSRLSAAEISDILGYQDATVLSRSFRRWHGKTIRDIRRQQTE